MNKLERRAERIARTQQRVAIDRIAALIKEELRGVRVEIGQSDIAISGAGMFKHWLTETRLRFIGGSLR